MAALGQLDTPGTIKSIDVEGLGKSDPRLI